MPHGAPANQNHTGFDTQDRASPFPTGQLTPNTHPLQQKPAPASRPHVHACYHGRTMRLFVAAQLPDSMVDALAETSAALRSCVKGRYVRPNLFHVTLAFLGEVNASRVDAAQEAVERTCSRHGAFEAALAGFGSFGKRTRATLWQGFQDEEPFVALAADVRGELSAAGLEFDTKKTLPHITLMRAADVSAGVLPTPQLASGIVDTVTLFQSDLSGPHPQYTSLCDWHLL